jgi:acyl-homoserine-lactone acylase
MRLAIAVLLTACSGAAPSARHAPPPPALTTYQAHVAWTSDGVPHISAADWGSLGFGQGYAIASLHLCEVEDQIVRIRSERARFFGAGPDDANLDSDFFHLHLGFVARAPAAIQAASPEAQRFTRGFVAGFNRWIATAPDARLPAACAGAAWVRPITEDDVGAMALAIATTASSRALIPLVARAHPRGEHASGVHLPRRELLASNGWAIGGERTASGGGLLLANPHFPWEGELQFWESHLTMPGQLDVYGAGLIGTPGIQIGFNAHVAWTHTFSSSTHFVFYRVPLAKDQPLRIAVGDHPEPIVPSTYTIDVKDDAGAIRHVSRTMYRTRWGPMIASDELPWEGAGGYAYALRDVALDDTTANDMYLAFARAGSIADVERALASSHTPFLNTLAADDHGDALYVDGARVPALSEDGLAAWSIGKRAIPALAAAWQHGVVVLDASMAAFELAGDEHGAIPIEHAPRARRRDWVMNANGPYDFTHRGVAMPANSPLYGDAATPSPRTIANWMLLDGDARLDRDAIGALLFSNQSSTAALLRDDVIAACPKDPACRILARWDGRFAVGSRGAALWREVLVELAPGGSIPWKVAYDPADATHTPRGLALDAVTIRKAVKAAADRLAAAGVDPDAPLGAVQTTHARDGGRAPVPGGQQLDGVANVAMWNPFNGTLLPHETRGEPISPTGLTRGGYAVDFGTSFVMAVDLTPAGPLAKVLLTYGNSGDPASPHHRDQLDALARGALRPALFTADQIAADRAKHPDLPALDLRYTEPAR